MNCGMEMIKYLLFFVNFIATLCGIGLIFIGVSANDENHKILVDTLPQLSVISNYTTALIVLGAVIAIIAFCGCCGALRESICLLNLFAIVFLTILVLQLIIGYLSFRTDFKEEIKKRLKKGIEDYNPNNPNELTKFIDETQQNFECCGITDFHDYRDNGKDVPKSCCKNLNQGETCGEGQKGLHKRRCLTALENYIKGQSDKVKTIAIIAVIVEILCVVLPLLLANSIRNADRGRYRV